MRREIYLRDEAVGFETDVAGVPVKFAYNAQVAAYDAIAAVTGCTVFEAAERLAMLRSKSNHGIETDSRRFGPGQEHATVTEQGFFALMNRIGGRQNDLAVEAISSTLSEIAQEWSKKALVREKLKHRLKRAS